MTRRAAGCCVNGASIKRPRSRGDAVAVPLRPRWTIEKIGEDFFTFIVFKPQTFAMGSPDEESFRRKNEHRHKVRMTRPFAISDREMTRGPFERLVVNP